MSESRSRPTLADYVAVAISPALIIAMVACLVYFLLEILYAGHHAQRLQWVFFCFITAVVLIARMTMTGELGDRSALYGIVLALATFVALQSLVEYPADSPLLGFFWLVNMGLMAIIWWSSHRLTWDCTHVDEAEDASGAGLLEAAGLDANSSVPEAGTPPEERKRPSKNSKKAGQRTGMLAWIDRYHEYQHAKRKQPHTLGIWVIYFSLAALPLFGLGQALIPPEALGRRQYAFWLLAGYAGSGLGLLLTTSFLGLRRYLRQRRLRMPLAMTGVWLGTGAALIIALLFLGALLPRPNAEYSLMTFSKPPPLSDRQASRFSVFREGAVKGKGSAGDEQGKSDAGQATRPSDSGGKSQDGLTDKDARNDAGGKSGEKNDKGEGKKSDQSKGADDKSSKSSGNGDQKTGDKQTKDKSSGSQQGGDGFMERFMPPAVQPLVSTLARMLKWVVFVLGALIVVFLVARSGLKFLANFTNWARRLLEAFQRWWQSLFGPGADRAQEAKSSAATKAPPRPFSAFLNPFLTGAADEQSAEAVVRYSFQALEAWAVEHSMARRDDETPIEFGTRLGQEIPPLDRDCRRLTVLYARAAYGPGSLPEGSLDVVREFWTSLESEAMPQASEASGALAT